MKNTKAKYNNKETDLAVRIASYLKKNHSDLLYRFDYAGMYLEQNDRVHARKLNQKGWPDLFIAKPVTPFAGLFLEIKHNKGRDAQGKSLHNQKQQEILKKLTKEGYLALQVYGFYDAVEKIENYLRKNTKRLSTLFENEPF